ncbi:MAG: N-acetylmuramoyl-L-alanine amidase family protein [Acidimicrobiales bacterium]
MKRTLTSEEAPPGGAPPASQALQGKLPLVLVVVIAIVGVVAVVQILTSSTGTRAASHHPSTKALSGIASRIGGTPVDASLFSSGSCVAFSPTRGDRRKTVLLDAGHGGVDPGAVGRTKSGATIYEKNLTLPVEMDAAAILRADGYRVVVSRTNGGPVAIPSAGAISGGIYTTAGAHDEVAARDVCANLAKANVLIGIYFDAGGSPLDAGSITSYDTSRPFAAANLRLAKLLQHDVLSAMNGRGWGIPNGGVNSDVYEGGPALTTAAANYDHLMLLGPAKAGFFETPSEMPGAVIEPLFATDPFEASIADSAVGQEVIAGGIAQTVEQFLG